MENNSHTKPTEEPCCKNNCCGKCQESCILHLIPPANYSSSLCECHVKYIEKTSVAPKQHMDKEERMIEEYDHTKDIFPFKMMGDKLNEVIRRLNKSI